MMTKMFELDRKLNQELGKLSDVLADDGYPFMAGYLDSFISMLPTGLELNQKQMKLFIDIVSRRVSDRMRLKTPSLVD